MLKHPKRHKTTTVSCRLEDEYIRQLKQIGEREDCTVSRVLRRIVLDALTRRYSVPTRTRRTHD